MRPNKSLKNKSGTCNTVPMRSTRPKTFHSKILVPELRSTPPCQKVSELLEQQQLEQFTTKFKIITGSKHKQYTGSELSHS